MAASRKSESDESLDMAFFEYDCQNLVKSSVKCVTTVCGFLRNFAARIINNNKV
jgi:hypothetical protein